MNGDFRITSGWPIAVVGVIGLIVVSVGGTYLWMRRSIPSEGQVPQTQPRSDAPRNPSSSAPSDVPRPDTVVAYVDSTVALPILASYLLERCPPRQPRRLYARLPELVDALRREYKRSPLHERHSSAPERNRPSRR